MMNHQQNHHQRYLPCFSIYLLNYNQIQLNINKIPYHLQQKQYLITNLFILKLRSIPLIYVQYLLIFFHENVIKCFYIYIQILSIVIQEMNLKYRVYSVSSELPEHPASDLLYSVNQMSEEAGQLHRFWESQPNPIYPQQLTIQFYIPIRTKNLQLTFHPYKIPKKVQLFVKLGMNQRHQKYQKLGYIVPSDNTQTYFLQKQRKTIFLEYPCTFIKIIMHQNYKNNRNLFDQVALWEFKVEGDCLPASEIRDLNCDCFEASDTEPQSDQLDELNKENTCKFADPNSISKDKNNDSQNSSMFPEVFKMLVSAKAEAVEKQDFEKASQIKQAISSFKNIESQIMNLQSEKRKALEDQDYDKCHRLKNEILKKKDQANFQIKELQQHYLDHMPEAHSRVIPHSYHPSISMLNNNNQNPNPAPNPTNRSNYPQDTPYSPIPNRSKNYSYNTNSQQAKNQQSQYYDKYQSQVVPALKKKIQQQFNSVSNNALNVSNNNSRVNQSVNNGNQHINSNNNVLESHSNRNYRNQDEPIKGKNTNRNSYELGNIQQYVEESVDYRNYDIAQIIADYPKLEPLDFKDDKKYQIYYDYIEADLWRMALSQTFWKLKGYVLDKVITFQVQEGHHVQALMQLVAIIIQDNHPVNVKKCLLLLQKLICMQDKNLEFTNTNNRYFIETILTNLLHLQTDTKQEFRKLATQIYKNLPDFSIFPLQQSIRTILKSNQANKNKRKYNAKQLLPKIFLIQFFVNTYHDTEVMFNQIIKWGVNMLEDPDSQVKNAVMTLLLEISFKNKQYYLKTKECIMKKKNKEQIWANFEAHYEDLIALYEQSQQLQQQSQRNQSKKSITEHSEDDIHKKQTIMNRKNKNKKYEILSPSQRDDAISHLQKMQESPIPTPNKMKDSAEIELAYSQESLFQQNSHQSHQWFANPNNNNDKSQEIRVMQEVYDNQIQGICQYCYREIGQVEIRQHLLENCPVLLPCTFCNGHIYLRQLNQHWLTKCPNKYHQQCPRCKVAIEIDEINEHKARNTCRKVSKSSYYGEQNDNQSNMMEICPLCQQDVQGDDFAWVQHSQKCDGVRQIQQKWKSRALSIDYNE